jgi:hypothetical protein
VLLALGCGSDPVAPEVSIVAQAPSSLVLGVDEEDDVSLRLGYEDGDGDLGGGVVHIYDCREEGASIALPIPEVASPEAVEDRTPISGELLALVPDIATASSDAEPAALCQEQGVSVAAGELVMCVTLEDAAAQQSVPTCSAPFSLAAP